MSLKDILDPILTGMPENELVLMVTHDSDSIEWPGTGSARAYFLRWGGFGKWHYSKDGSEAHLYANGEILRLAELNGAWRNHPVQVPILPKPNEEGKTYFTLFSQPEIAMGKGNIAVALAKYGLMSHYRFVELQEEALPILHI